jgi:hypothetical protein
VATSLQTRAPTGNVFGPVFTSLLSRPITFQVRGSIVSVACAAVASRRTAAKMNKRVAGR